VEARTTFYVKDEYPEELKPLVAEILLESSFFQDMLPVAGAKEALEEMQEKRFEVFICTSPLSTYNNCVLEKYKWVEKVLGPAWVKQIILTKDKTVIKGDFLIDDKPLITGAQDPPEWEHILYDRPYNKGANRRRLTWDNWKDILLAPPQV
jgi:5'-nucleotidase